MLSIFIILAAGLVSAVLVVIEKYAASKGVFLRWWVIAFLRLPFALWLFAIIVDLIFMKLYGFSIWGVLLDG